MKKIIKQYQEKGTVVIGYARVSSRDNRQELGLEVQKEALHFCDRLYMERNREVIKTAHNFKSYQASQSLC